MILKSLQTGTNLHGKIVSQHIEICFCTDMILGSFGQQGVDYKDWLECNVKNPLALNGR